jgi:hypothetical protein
LGAPSPRRNRVTPLGDLIATTRRGAWGGNRGILHREDNIVRFHTSNLWITCALEFRGRWQRQWQPHHYTFLFFHDEAVSFAAGHRPCAECRREAYSAYRAAWAGELGVEPPSAQQINASLHGERIVRGTHRRRLHPMPCPTAHSSWSTAQPRSLRVRASPGGRTRATGRDSPVRASASPRSSHRPRPWPSCEPGTRCRSTPRRGRLTRPMTYDELLANRLRECLQDEAGVTEKRMFGGLAFLVNGNLALSASGRGGLLLRVEPGQTESLAAKPHAGPFVMRGRELDGWLRIDPEGIRTQRQLIRWAKIGVSYARRLPAK